MFSNEITRLRGLIEKALSRGEPPASSTVAYLANLQLADGGVSSGVFEDIRDQLAASGGFVGATQVSSTGVSSINDVWAPLSSVQCTEAVIHNETGIAIEYRHRQSSTSFELGNGSAIALPCISSANEWELKRVTGSGAVNVSVMYLSSLKGVRHINCFSGLTSSTGTNWVPFQEFEANRLFVQNPNAFELRLRRVGSAADFGLPPASTTLLPVNVFSSEWEIRRADTSNTQAPFRVMALKDALGVAPLGNGDQAQLDISELEYLVSSRLPLSLGAKTGAQSISIVPASDAGLATNATLIEVRDRIGVKPYAAFSDRIHTIHDYITISGTSASTGDENLREIDWNSPAFQGVPAIYVTGLTVGNTTPPGANRTITLNVYWSDIQMGNINNAPVQLKFRKTVLGVATLENEASAVRYYKFGGILVPEARYAYFSTERSAQDSGSSIFLTTWAVRVMA